MNLTDSLTRISSHIEKSLIISTGQPCRAMSMIRDYVDKILRYNLYNITMIKQHWK